jgi:hypothetical protein
MGVLSVWRRSGDTAVRDRRLTSIMERETAEPQIDLAGMNIELYQAAIERGSADS